MRKFQFSILAAGALSLMVAGCQTVPHQPGFSAVQVAVLKQEGFQPRDNQDFALQISDRVLFAVDQDMLVADNAEIVARMARELVRVGIVGATVEGHTDSQGSAAYNQGLSERRAAAVTGALKSAGMDPARITAVGRGETDPIADNATEEGRTQNRRVVIIVGPEHILVPAR